MKEQAKEWLSWLTKTVLFWKTNDAERGKLLRFLHNLVIDGVLFMVIASHTFYRSYVLQTFVLGILFLIWLQHMAFHCCIFTDVERDLIGDNASITGPWVELFGIEPTPDLTRIVMLTVSTVGFGALLLEWISRTLHKVSKVYEHLPQWTGVLKTIIGTTQQVLASHPTSVAS
jgi:hypothetical protein